MFPLSVIINSDVTSRNQLQCHVGDNVLLLYVNINIDLAVGISFTLIV